MIFIGPTHCTHRGTPRIRAPDSVLFRGVGALVAAREVQGRQGWGAAERRLEQRRGQPRAGREVEIRQRQGKDAVSRKHVQPSRRGRHLLRRHPRIIVGSDAAAGAAGADAAASLSDDDDDDDDDDIKDDEDAGLLSIDPTNNATRAPPRMRSQPERLSVCTMEMMRTPLTMTGMHLALATSTSSLVDSTREPSIVSHAEGQDNARASRALQVLRSARRDRESGRSANRECITSPGRITRLAIAPKLGKWEK